MSLAVPKGRYYGRSRVAERAKYAPRGSEGALLRALSRVAERVKYAPRGAEGALWPKWLE